MKMHTLENLFATGVSMLFMMLFMVIGGYFYIRWWDSKMKYFVIVFIILCIVWAICSYYLWLWFIDIGWVTPCKGSMCNMTG